MNSGTGKNITDSLELLTVRQLVFIDSQVENYQFLASKTIPGVEVIILQKDCNGIAQISEVLQSQSQVGNIHIVSHGSPGCLHLGNSQLSLDTLDSYTQDLKTWFSNSSLIPHPSSLLIYGCNVAAGDAGAEFIAKLHDITDVEVAASTTRIGNAARGGNWQLDYQTSKIASIFPFTEVVKESYAGIFAKVIYENITSQSFGSSLSTFTRTFEVTEEGTLNGLTLGFNATHTYRGDIEVTLTSPNGTSVVAIASANDDTDNYDILLETGGGILDDNVNDNTASPYYDRSVTPSNPFSAFANESIQGTWTLTVEDTFTGQDDGTFNRAQLGLDFTPEFYSIEGSVFNDTNNPSSDTLDNPGDTPLSGVTVELYNDTNGDGNPDGAAIGSVQTSSDGFYEFTNQTAGNYVVRQVTPNGFTSVTDADGGDSNSISVSVSETTNTSTIDIANLTGGATTTNPTSVTVDGVTVNLEIANAGTAAFGSTIVVDGATFFTQDSDLSDGNAFTGGSPTVDGQTPDDVNLNNYLIFKFSASEPINVYNFALSDLDLDHDADAVSDDFHDATTVIIRDQFGNFTSPAADFFGADLETYAADLVNASNIDSNFAAITTPFAVNPYRNSNNSATGTINLSPIDASGRVTYNSLTNVEDIYVLYWNEREGVDAADPVGPDGDGQGFSIVGDIEFVTTASDVNTGNDFLVESNTPPTVDLNGNDAGEDYSTVFSQGSAGVAIADPTTIVTDNSGNITNATIILTNPQTGDVLNTSALPTGTGIIIDPSSTATNILLTGTATVAQYQAAIAAITFSNSETLPDRSDRTIDVVVNDGTLSSNTATTTIEWDTDGDRVADVDDIDDDNDGILDSVELQGAFASGNTNIGSFRVPDQGLFYSSVSNPLNNPLTNPQGTTNDESANTDVFPSYAVFDVVSTDNPTEVVATARITATLASGTKPDTELRWILRDNQPRLDVVSPDSSDTTGATGVEKINTVIELFAPNEDKQNLLQGNSGFTPLSAELTVTVTDIDLNPTSRIESVSANIDDLSAITVETNSTTPPDFTSNDGFVNFTGTVNNPSDGVRLTYINKSSFEIQVGTTGNNAGFSFDLSNSNIFTNPDVTVLGVDSDADGLIDSLDIDSDDDGIPDNIEAQTTADYIAPSGQGGTVDFIDTNGDGLDDNYDNNTAAGNSSGATGTGLTPVDTDSTLGTTDGTPDYLDADSDNDGILDIAENGFAANSVNPTDADTDSDGLKDVFETANTSTVNDGFDVNDAIDTPLNGVLPDTDSDAATGTPLTADLDYRDALTNLLPTANPDTNTATEAGTVVSDNVLSDDDLGDEPTTVTAADQGGVAITLGTPFTTTNSGSLTLNSDGTYSYTPPAQGQVPAGGLTEVFNYTITDENGDSSSTTLTIDVADNNLLPNAVPDTNTATEAGTVVSDNVLTGDTLGDEPTTVTAADQGGNVITLGTPFTTTNGGSLTLNSNGSYSYTPPAQGEVPTGGLTEVFNYTITDENGDSSSTTLTIDVADNNLLPTANPDTKSATEAGTVVTDNVLSDDNLGDEPTTVTAADQGGNVITLGTPFTTESGGSLTLNSDGSYSYTPPAQGEVPNAGLTEVFNYTITDADGDTSSTTLTIDVANNTPPAIDLDADDSTDACNTGGVGASNPSPVAVNTINANYVDINDSSNDYTAPGFGGNASDYSSSTNYDLSFSTATTANNNLVLESVEVNGVTMPIATQADNVFVRRADNADVSGDVEFIWFQLEEHGGSTDTTAEYSPEFVSTIEESLNSPIINRGTDNAFDNVNNGGAANNNIERIDYIFSDGLQAALTGEAGFTIVERNGNDDIKIAAITAIDGDGNPTAFGTLTNVPRTAFGGNAGSFQTTTFRDADTTAGIDLQPNSDIGTQTVKASFVSFESLGVAANQTIYGYTLFGNDVNPSTPSDLLDWTDDTVFPQTTDGADGGSDLIGGGSFVASPECLDAVHTFTEGDNPITVGDSDAFVTDNGENDLVSLQIVVDPALITEGANEIVSIAGQPVPINADASFNDISVGNSIVDITYTAATGTFTIVEGNDPANVIPQADLNTLVQGITYQNTSNNPTEADRTFSFTVTDATNLTSEPAVSTITVVAVNDLPLAVPDTNSATEAGAVVSDNVLTGDDLGDEPTIVTSAEQGLDEITLGTPFTTSNGGSLTLNSDGTYSYTPPAQGEVSAGGLTEVFNYTITDENGDTSSTTLTIDVADNNTPPVLDLDGNASPGVDYSITFVSEAVSITDSANATGSDPDGNDIESLNFTVNNVLDTNNEFIVIGGTDFDLGSNDTQSVSINGTSYDVTVTNNGTDFNIVPTAGGDLTSTQVNELLRDLTYRNDAPNPTLGDRTIDLILNDGTSNSNTATSTISIPFGIDLDGDNSSGATGNDYQTTFTENALGVAIADSDLVLNTSGNVTGATIELTNRQPGDVFTLGTFQGGITGVVDNTSDPNKITVTLSGNASAADYKEALSGLGAIAFSNATEDPDPSDRNITVTVTDGVDSTTANTTVQVIPVNDPPIVDLNGNTPAVSTVSSNSVDDAQPTVTGTISNGGSSADYTLTRTDKTGGSTTVQYTAGSNGIETKNNAFNNQGDSFTYQFDVTPDAGVDVESVSLYRVGYTTGGNEEDSSMTLTWTGGGAGVISDPDDQISNYADGDIITTGAVLEFRLPDGDGSGANSASSWQVDVAADNLNVEVIDDPNSSSLMINEWLTFNANITQDVDYQNTFTENGSPVAIADVETFTADVDDINLESGKVTFTNPQTDDRLVIDSVPVASGDNGTVNGIAYTVSTDVDGKLIVDLTGSASKADYANAIELIEFENTSDDPTTTPNRILEVTVNDGELDSNIATSTIEVIPLNDPPVLDLDSNNSSGATGADYQTSFSKNGGAVAIADLDTSVTDLDDTNIETATITLTNPQTDDRLLVDGTPVADGDSGTVNGVPYSVSAGVDGELIINLSGSATLADYETAIEAISFENTSENPNLTDRILSVVVNDGTSDSNTATTTIQWDTDGDGVADTVDLDDDNDGVADVDELPAGLNPDADSDGDGTPDYLDPDAVGFTDANNDGVDDRYDTDSDGVIDSLDIDSDNDGIVDVIEAGGEDVNGDGFIDNFTDANNDGENDATATTPLDNPDTDNDGIKDVDDIDADNDGIPDNVEAQPTVGYIVPSGIDTDGDGLDDAYDANNGGTAINPVDTESDDTPDYIDLDSDGDNIPDIQENGMADVVSGTDTDGDGLDDAFEGSNLNDGFDVNDEINNPAVDLPDTQNPGGDVDYRDAPVQPGNISGTVTSSDDGSGIADVTISLLNLDNTPVTDSNGNPIVATTGTDGSYQFTNVAPGNYKIQETNLPNYLDDSDSDGDNPNIVNVTISNGTNAIASFVDTPRSNVSGTVTSDNNSPLSGVEIGLFASDGTTPILDGNNNPLTAITGNNGIYTFTNIQPGDYTVIETNLPGYGDVSDSDGNANGDNTIAISFAPGESAEGNDFVDTPLSGSIAGTVFSDIDDTGIAGVTVGLFESNGTTPILDGGNNPITATTGTNGNYTFTNVTPGDYTVIETNLPGYADVSDSDGDANGDNTIAVSLASGESSEGNDFTDIPLPQTISGSVTANGAGINGVNLRLLDSNGFAVTNNDGEPVTATTGVDGSYSFPDIPIGEYTIVQTNLPGYKNVSDSDGGNDNRIDVTLTPNTPATGNNFVDAPTISGRVWDDSDGNGLEGFFEDGLAGVGVTLTGAGDNGIFGDGDDPADVITTTDSNGRYEFDTFDFDEQYQIAFDLPPSLESEFTGFTTKDIAGNSKDRIDSDVNPTTSITDAFTVPLGQAKGNIDAGLISEADQIDISGTASPDNLNGTPADEIIAGFKGQDTLTGGGGSDTFFLNETSEGVDIITDFDLNDDKIDFTQILDREVGYSGTDPIGDGYIVPTPIGNRGTMIQVNFDLNDGINPKSVVFLAGVTDADNFDVDNIIFD